MSDRVNRLIEQRQLRRGVMALLAEPLQGAEKEVFLSVAEEDLNTSLPAPGRHHMRLYLKAVK